jgi:hypothetical protein
MSSGALILAVVIVFFLANVYWNNKLFMKKRQLEERERKLNMKGESE